MATLSVLPPNDTAAKMNARRAPLLEKPNAANSPLRTIAGKRTRAQAGDQKDAIYGQPPTKRQAMDPRGDNEENVDPHRKHGATVVLHDKLDDAFSKPRGHHAQTPLERKLASVREKKPIVEQRRRLADSYDSVRQWQKHYRRQFPQFVFYFDGVGEDVRSKQMRQIHQLGAREEKFFSKAVTHVVTTRPIPAEQSAASPDEDATHDNAPSKAATHTAAPQDQRRATMLLDQRRSQHAAVSLHPSIDLRKQPQNTDVLVTARSLNIKIWALEKLHRVLNTILDGDAGDRAPDARTHATTRGASRQTQDADLEQLLRHEKVNGPADRDRTVATQDMCVLKGLYIYVHDMDEKTKPVMVRDYAKPASREQGKWPQFRLSAPGRCPFVDDPAWTKKIQQQEERALSKASLELAQRKSRTGSALPMAPLQALAECEVNLRRSPRKLSVPPKPTTAMKPLDPPPTKRQSSMDMAPVWASAQSNVRGLPRMIGGEIVASGMQRSNVTSAIRSQAVSSAAISSTASGLNRRLGDTKEVALLKRKMLASNGSMPSSYAADMRAAINNSQDPPPRAAKRKAQETLGVVQEDDENEQRPKGKSNASKRAKVQKEAKPGYCENCRDKYDDFDEHILSRKHRKFATSQDNWEDLDKLLDSLKRRMK